MQSSFTSTFHPSALTETLLGTLHLKDGSSHIIGINNADKRFGEYVKSIMEFSSDKERANRILGE